MLFLSRVVWDYSSNSLVVVMTHQRLNIGVYIKNKHMQWKPIANKYRKGTMKSTLHSTCVELSQLLTVVVMNNIHSSNGSEIESEIA
jgi:hypothetical protein